MRPVLVTLLGRPINSAPVFAGFAALAAYFYFERRRAELRLSDDDFWTLMLSLMLGVFAGSVGVYFVAYGGGLARNVEVLRGDGVIAGGSYLGTFAGAAAAAWAFCRLRRRPYLPVADVLAAAAPLGLVFMRVGCLLNGCCYGKPTTLPWGVVFDGPCAVPTRLRGAPLHPTQAYEALGALGIFLVLQLAVRPAVRAGRLRDGDGLAVSVGLYGLLRYFVDFARAGDPGVVLPLGHSLAQVVCAAAVMAAAGRLVQGVGAPRRSRA